ncbi:hypothetical protein ZHAS_00009432 [Anopheles sinensis]|uniref:Uncharacterized protein n=1 Tax=Anopheles sinensis TaxID=74873 RepID=A0A084VUZ4_ANOSI|nr:hypothetical protein ZHAS_00009432 [Anopheles sinensis]
MHQNKLPPPCGTEGTNAGHREGTMQRHPRRVRGQCIAAAKRSTRIRVPSGLSMSRHSLPPAGPHQHVEFRAQQLCATPLSTRDVVGWQQVSKGSKRVTGANKGGRGRAGLGLGGSIFAQNCPSLSPAPQHGQWWPVLLPLTEANLPSPKPFSYLKLPNPIPPTRPRSACERWRI